MKWEAYVWFWNSAPLARTREGLEARKAPAWEDLSGGLAQAAPGEGPCPVLKRLRWSRHTPLQRRNFPVLA